MKRKRCEAQCPACGGGSSNGVPHVADASKSAMAVLGARCRTYLNAIYMPYINVSILMLSMCLIYNGLYYSISGQMYIMEYTIFHIFGYMLYCV